MATQTGKIRIDRIEVETDDGGSTWFIHGILESVHDKNVYRATWDKAIDIMFEVRETLGLSIDEEMLRQGIDHMTFKTPNEPRTEFTIVCTRKDVVDGVRAMETDSYRVG